MSNQEEIREIEKKYVYGTWRYENTWNPVIIESGEGCYIIDLDGNVNRASLYYRINKGMYNQLRMVKNSNGHWSRCYWK